MIGGYYGLAPKIAQLVADDKVQAWNLPEGILTHLYRDIGAGKPGTLSASASARSSIRGSKAGR